MYRPNLHSVAVAVPETIAVLGWGCEPPILGKGRPQGVGDGTVRKSVYDFLLALHSNFSSIFTRFRDIGAFVLLTPLFPPHLQSHPNFPMFRWEQVDDLWATKSEVLGQLSVQLVFKFSNLCNPDPPTSQTDRQTDGQTDGRTTCNLNTALCISASRGKNPVSCIFCIFLNIKTAVTVDLWQNYIIFLRHP